MLWVELTRAVVSNCLLHGDFLELGPHQREQLQGRNIRRAPQPNRSDTRGDNARFTGCNDRGVAPEPGRAHRCAVSDGHFSVALR